MGRIPMNFHVESIFACNVGRRIINEIDLSPLNAIKKYPYLSCDEDDPECGNYISESKKILNDFPQIKQHILTILHAYIDSVYHYENEFEITTSWATCIQPNVTTYLHNHQNSMFSGVLYLPSDYISPISFEEINRSSYSIIPKEYNIYNSIEWIVNPSPNEIILFPSSVYHRIKKNKGTENRFSIAMNFIPTGEYGKEDSYLNVIKGGN